MRAAISYIGLILQAWAISMSVRCAIPFPSFYA